MDARTWLPHHSQPRPLPLQPTFVVKSHPPLSLATTSFLVLPSGQQMQQPYPLLRQRRCGASFFCFLTSTLSYHSIHCTHGGYASRACQNYAHMLSPFRICFLGPEPTTVLSDFVPQLARGFATSQRLGNQRTPFTRYSGDEYTGKRFTFQPVHTLDDKIPVSTVCASTMSRHPEADVSWFHHFFLKGPALLQMLRAFCFYALTYIVAIPLFVVMLVVHPFVMVLDKHKRKAHHFINKVWAHITISLFYKAQIEGLENLPEPDEPAVYVSNHQSFLDIYTLLLLGRPFKFISKTSNFLIPIIGWSMYLTGHIPLHRMDTKSRFDCFRHCLTLVKQGVSLVFFPEGTRSKDGKMAYFKKGAFTVAVKGKLPVIPISLIGTGKLMPNGLEYTLRPGSVKAVIHPPLRGSNPDDLCEQARAVIYECLLKHGSEVY